MLAHKFKIFLIAALIIALVFPGYLSFVASSSGNITINKQGSSTPGIHVSAGGNVSLYLGGVMWNYEEFYLFITQDSLASQLGSGLVYTPIFSVYDVASSSLSTQVGDYGGWRLGDNWINGSIPLSTAPGNYYIKAADQIGAAAVTDTYIVVDPVNYNEALNISPSSGPGGIPITLSGSQWPVNSSVQIQYYDPVFGTWSLLNTTTTNQTGQFSYVTKAPDLKKSVAAYESPETYNTIQYRVQTPGGVYSSQATYNEYSRGLSRVGSLTSYYGLYGNGTNLVSQVRVKSGDQLTIDGKWFYANSPIYIRWDGYNVVDTVSSNQWQSASLLGTTAASINGTFSKTVTIPDAAAGEHYIQIEDSQTWMVIKIFTSTAELNLSPSAGPGGVAVMFSGSGYPSSQTVDLYYQDPYTGYYNFFASTTSSPTGTISYNVTIPDIAVYSYSGDNYNYGIINFRADVTGVSYAYGQYTEYSRGLTQVGSRVAYNAFGNGTDLTDLTAPR